MTTAETPTGTETELLFTPGPLTTSSAVREAMLRDYGSRDAAFIEIVADTRKRLLALAGVDATTHAAIPMQGSGTFSLEAVLASTVPAGSEVLVAVNGAYGRRHVQIAERLGINTHALVFPETEPVDPARVAAALVEHPGVSHVVATHCETTTGLLNPLDEIAATVRGAGRLLMLDAMSSFGGMPLNIAESPVDYLVSSSNKCIEGTPGFGFTIARLEPLLASRGASRSVSLDLLAQHEGLEKSGQFRFTPPTHVFAAFHQALLALEAEGGVPARAARYAENHRILVDGMRSMGYETLLPDDLQSHIITTFRQPSSGFDFNDFYDTLAADGLVIYPGKLTEAPTFRIGNIGQIQVPDIRRLLDAIALYTSRVAEH